MEYIVFGISLFLILIAFLIHIMDRHRVIPQKESAEPEEEIAEEKFITEKEAERLLKEDKNIAKENLNIVYKEEININNVQYFLFLAYNNTDILTLSAAYIVDKKTGAVSAFNQCVENKDE